MIENINPATPIVSLKNSKLSLNLKSKKNLLVYRDLCREKEILEQVPDKQTTEITVKLLAQGKSKEQDFKGVFAKN